MEYGEKNAFKDTGVGWLLLSCIDTLKRNKEKARVLPGLMAKCERQKTSLVAYKEASMSYSGRADTVKPQTQVVIEATRVPETFKCATKAGQGPGCKNLKP